MILTRCTSTTTLFWLLTVLNLASFHYICGLYCLFLSVFLLHLLCTSISLCLPGKTCFYLNHAVLCTYVSLCLYVFTNADKSPGYNVSNECFCKPLICPRFTSVANLAYRIHSHCAYVCLLAPCRTCREGAGLLHSIRLPNGQEASKPFPVDFVATKTGISNQTMMLS